MESVLHDYDDEEETAHEYSDIELEELITTKFVELVEVQNRKEDEKIETARAVGSPMELCSPIQLGNDHFILEEHASLMRPVEEKVDNAVQLLSRILRSSENDLKTVHRWNYFEKSKKWKNTSRVSELNLINSIVPLVDNRPTQLHVHFRRLIESDISNIIRQCLLDVEPPTKFASLFRITMKTEMPLKQVIGQLVNLSNSSPNIQVQDNHVTALRKNLDGTNQKFITKETQEFAEMETKLSSPYVHPMIASARFVLKNFEKPFITVNVGYFSELDLNGKRCKTIAIEHLVSPPPGIMQSRRVTFGTPLVEKVHQFEIADGLPFLSLKFPFKIKNLIEFLESPEQSFHQNVTYR